MNKEKYHSFTHQIKQKFDFLGSDHQQLLTRLNCAYGLAELATGKYKNSAKHFLLANIDHCGIPDMMSPHVRIFLE